MSETTCTTCGGRGEYEENRGEDEYPDWGWVRCHACAGKGFWTEADIAKRQQARRASKASTEAIVKEALRRYDAIMAKRRQ